jgi:membrane protease YdiL (CAAX protease family)
MGTSRSEQALSPGHGLSVFFLGLAGMILATAAAQGLGLRTALMAGELGLVLPGLVALAARVPLAEALALRTPPVFSILASVAAGAALWVFSIGLMSLQVLVFQPPAEYFEMFKHLHEALRPTGPLDALLSVAAIAVLPGVCEELLFRGMLLPSLLRSAGPAMAAVISALLFGVIHLHYVPGQPLMLDRVPFAIAVGLGLGALRLGSGSLWPPILAHAALNTLTFVVVLVTSGTREQTAEGSLPLGLALLATGGLGFALCARSIRPAAATREDRLP